MTFIHMQAIYLVVGKFCNTNYIYYYINFLLLVFNFVGSSRIKKNDTINIEMIVK